MPAGQPYSVEVRGIGKPDYSREVSSAITRRGIKRKYNQVLKVFCVTIADMASPYPWVVPVLAPGGTVHPVDNDTGIPTPFTLPKGWTLSLIETVWTAKEDLEAWMYIDGDLVSSGGIIKSGVFGAMDNLLGLTTVALDPAGASEHILDVTITNTSPVNTKGWYHMVTLLERVGTPPMPKVKTVRCKWCGYEHTVPNETTNITCPQCGRLFKLFDLTKIRGTL